MSRGRITRPRFVLGLRWRIWIRSLSSISAVALILLGTHKALGRYLAQSEVIFEYRSTEAAGPANQRIEYRQGFLAWYEKLWETINLRNDRQHIQDGLFMLDIPTFSEATAREAILNAVGHRDYRNQGSVFIRQFPRCLEKIGREREGIFSTHDLLVLDLVRRGLPVPLIWLIVC
jgi:predicted HTH transcriptional regulator